MEFFHVSDAIGRLESFGLPRYLAISFYREVEKWAAHSGPAWTVDRLKNLKTDLLRQKAGLPRLTWVKKNRKGDWYGAVGAIFRHAMKSEKAFRASLCSLMIYSGFKPNGPTESHRIKFLKAVSAPPPFIPNSLINSVADEAEKWLGQLKLGGTIRLIDYMGHPSVKAPTLTTSVPQNAELERDLDWIGSSYFDPHLQFINRFYECYGPLFDGIDRVFSYGRGNPGLTRGVAEMGPFQIGFNPLAFEVDYSTVLAGNVVPLVKDGGWKVRWIASPMRLHQMALKPLGVTLFRALKSLPWDCTHDQDRAIPVIQAHLRKGRTAFAVDLSSATDYFPLDLQLGVLRRLVPDSPYVDLFHALSRAKWRTQGMGYVTWTRGQPMGLYPSFASFGLTHGFLLSYLAGIYRNQFFVLGDDVVILDRRIYENYIRTLDLLECPHDPHKSFVSSRVTEFAGKVITAEAVYPQYKWKPINDDNFIDFMKAYGQRFSRNLTPSQRRVYKAIAPLLKPLGCEHSLGLSEPLEIIAERTEDLDCKKAEEKGRKYFTSFLRKLTRLIPGNRKSLYNRLEVKRIRELTDTFDQKVSSAFQLLPQWILPLSEDLTDLFELVGIEPGLSAVGHDSQVARKTTLQLYQQWLGIDTKEGF